MPRAPKPMIGWEEVCALPDLGLPAIKAKVDTGAKTSALHAYDIKTFSRDGQKYVRFKVHPLQRNSVLERECAAPLVDRRYVISSNGERERRYVINTRIVLGEKKFQAELTLTSRHNMAFRMLLGREALRRARVTVDPVKSCMTGRKKNLEKFYET